MPRYLREHEQSETIQNKLGRWFNVFGKNTPQAGQPLPRKYKWEKPDYETVEEAVAAAKKRSELERPAETPLNMTPGPRLRFKGE